MGWHWPLGDGGLKRIGFKNSGMSGFLSWVTCGGQAVGAMGSPSFFTTGCGCLQAVPNPWGTGGLHAARAGLAYQPLEADYSPEALGVLTVPKGWVRIQLYLTGSFLYQLCGSPLHAVCRGNSPGLVRDVWTSG